MFKNKSIHFCSNCGLYYAHEMPSDTALNEYNSSYWGNAHAHTVSSSFDNPWFNLLASLRHKYLADHIILNDLSILEIGPGEGYLAKRILSNHHNITYDVVETDTIAQQALQKLPLNVFNSLSCIPGDQQYDLVIVSHVLEHVSCPKHFISIIKSFIRRSGLLFVEVPCLDFLYKSIYDPHLLFFDKRSLDFLLNIHSFDLLDSSYAGQEIECIPKSNLQMLLQYISYRILLKLSKRFDLSWFVNIFFSNIKSLWSLDASDQKLMCLYHSCHVQSDEPSRWLRAIAINSK